MKKNDILMIHGTDYKEMTMALLERADLASMIGSRKARVALKPNLVTDTPPSLGATTHTELCAGTIEYLRRSGFENICIMESSWVGCRTDAAFSAAGYDRLCREYRVPFIDLQKDKSREVDSAGMKLKICEQALEADFLINMPVVKGHCQTVITCALKNHKGLIPNSEKRRFHTMGLHRPIAHLAAAVRDGFILADNICGDLDFEEGGNPVVMNRILGFADPVLCDAYVCESLGHSVEDVPYIRMAEALGAGCADTSRAQIIMLNEPAEHTGKMQMTGRVQRLAAYAEPENACSACYGSLIHALCRMEEAGELPRGAAKIAIGQGYKGCTGQIGVGRCTAGFEKSVPGCPPTAAAMLAFLRENWKS